MRCEIATAEAVKTVYAGISIMEQRKHQLLILSKINAFLSCMNNNSNQSSTHVQVSSEHIEKIFLNGNPSCYIMWGKRSCDSISGSPSQVCNLSLPATVSPTPNKCHNSTAAQVHISTKHWIWRICIATHDGYARNKQHPASQLTFFHPTTQSPSSLSTNDTISDCQHLMSQNQRM